MLVACVAGILQGFVEWLPVSSKTMITLVFAAGGYRLETGYVMGLLANFGSFFAALWYFREDIWAAIRGIPQALRPTREGALFRYLFLATLATGVVGIPIYLGVTTAFNLTTGAEAMVAIGLLLLATSAVSRQRERLAARQGAAAAGQGSDPPGGWAALIVGACQGLAALPGISRSAVTVTPLLWLGRPADQALRLSFLLDVVALLGTAAVPLAVGHHGLAAVRAVGLGPVAVLVVTAAVVSFFTIGGILRLAQRLRSSVVTAAIGVLTIAAAVILYLR